MGFCGHCFPHKLPIRHLSPFCVKKLIKCYKSENNKFNETFQKQPKPLLQHIINEDLTSIDMNQYFSLVDSNISNIYWYEPVHFIGCWQSYIPVYLIWAVRVSGSLYVALPPWIYWKLRLCSCVSSAAWHVTLSRVYGSYHACPPLPDVTSPGTYRLSPLSAEFLPEVKWMKLNVYTCTVSNS